MRTRSFLWRRALRIVPAYWAGPHVLLGDWRGLARRPLVAVLPVCADLLERHRVPRDRAELEPGHRARVLPADPGVGPADPPAGPFAPGPVPGSGRSGAAAGCCTRPGSSFGRRYRIRDPAWRAISWVWLPTNIDLFAMGMALAVVSAWAATDERVLARADRVGQLAGLWWAIADRAVCVVRLPGRAGGVQRRLSRVLLATAPARRCAHRRRAAPPRDLRCPGSGSRTPDAALDAHRLGRRRVLRPVPLAFRLDPAHPRRACVHGRSGAPAAWRGQGGSTRCPGTRTSGSCSPAGSGSGSSSPPSAGNCSRSHSSAGNGCFDRCRTGGSSAS